MAEIAKISIHQTLHGYRSGHKLLSASLDLSDADKRTMLNLSDYSGSGFEKGFETYLTGYPLSAAKIYVLAKTWYADEMRRPGCVWTHSLLINYTDLWTIKSMGQLLLLFRRPSIESIDTFSATISYPIADNFLPEILLDETYRALTCQLYSSKKNLVLLSHSSIEYQNHIFNIWDRQWPRLKRTFSFSTGSLSLRKMPNVSFDIQIAPFTRERSLLSNDEVNLIDLSEKSCSNELMSFYWRTEGKLLEQFMVKYGADVSGTRENFLALVKGYQLCLSFGNISIAELKDYFKTYLPAPTEGLQLKVFLVESLLKQDSGSKYTLIKLLLDDTALSPIRWDFSKIISQAIDSHDLSQEEIISLYFAFREKEMYPDARAVLDYVQSEWLPELRLSIEEFSYVLSTRPNVQFERNFWHAISEVQQSWFHALCLHPGTNWSEVVKSMLEAGSDAFATQLYENQGIIIADAVLEWLCEGERQISSRWIEGIVQFKEHFIESLFRRHNVNNKALLRLALDILSLDDISLRLVSIEVLDSFLLAISRTKFEREIVGFYTLFLTAAYSKTIPNAEILNRIIFQQLHDWLKRGVFDAKSWNAFKTVLQKDVDDISRRSVLFNLFNFGNTVPEWDRCEFLRRSLLVKVMQGNWNPMELVFSVNEPETFDRILMFCSQTTDGYNMLQYIYKNLSKSKQRKSFHYTILKRIVD